MFSSILLEFRNDDEPEGVSGSGNLTASSTSPSLTIRKTVTDNIPEAEKSRFPVQYATLTSFMECKINQKADI